MHRLKIKFCRFMKRMDERINEGVLQWFDHIERMRNDRITKKVYVGEGGGSTWVVP